MRLIPSFALTVAAIGVCGSSLAQTPATEVYSDFGGFWSSSAASISATQPNNHHHLTAFTVGGTTYSTGVDDASLDDNAVTYTPGNFRAITIDSIAIAGAPASFRIIQGGAIDGDAAVGQNITAPADGAAVAAYLTDGTNGLDLGTGLSNVPSGTYNMRVTPPDTLKIGDGIPDFLFTQAGVVPAVVDSIYLVDDQGDLVGTKVAIDWSATTSVGQWSADYANLDGTTAGTSPYVRDLYIVTIEMQEMGLSAANYADVWNIRVVYSGESDPTFMSYNADSFLGCASLALSSVTTTPASAAASTDGSLIPSITGGINPYGLVINGDTLTTASSWENIASGKYMVQAIDSEDCTTLPIMVNIPYSKCN